VTDPARATPPSRAGLTERELQVLEFEARWWRHAGAKEDGIRAEFGLSAARYYQLLNLVIDRPEALRHDPLLVGRLLRARDARVRARASRKFTTDDDHERG
jgi:hypothetical protein